MAKMPEINLGKLEMQCSEDFTYAVKLLAESLAKNTRTKVSNIRFTWAHTMDGSGIIMETRMDTERGM